MCTYDARHLRVVQFQSFQSRVWVLRCPQFCSPIPVIIGQLRQLSSEKKAREMCLKAVRDWRMTVISNSHVSDVPRDFAATSRFVHTWSWSI